MDPIQEQINVITPFINELSSFSVFKKDTALREAFESAKKAIEFQDVSPTIDLILRLFTVQKKKIRLLCFKTIYTLFTSSKFEFFLAQNTSTEFIRKIVSILDEYKSPQFAEACKSLGAFLKSPNEQLYLHNDDLSFLLQNILRHADQNKDADNRKISENILRNFIDLMKEHLNGNKIDAILLSDFRIIIITIVKFMTPSITDHMMDVMLGIFDDFMFSASDAVRESQQYKEAMMVEVPQLFIQIAFTAPDQFYDRITEMFKKYVAAGEYVIPSFPALVDQLITPTFEGMSLNVLKAVSFLEVIGTLEQPILLLIFAMCDCSSTDSHRIFENLVQAIANCCMNQSANASISHACLRCLFTILASFHNFFLTAESGDQKSSDSDRFVLEKKMTMEGCAAIFNESVKKGVASMIQSELVEDDQFKIGIFMRKCQLLNPAQVSDYIVRPENTKVLDGFISTFNFAGEALDQALRALCAAFLLPGEAQQIDRVMVAFSKKYHSDNQWMSENAAYAISFSIIMLQTDLHNANIKRKITCEEWIKNTREVEDAKEIEVSVLKEIYARVAAKPLKLSTIFSADGNAETMRKKSRKLLQALMEKSKNEGLPTLSRELLILVIDRLWPTLFAVLSVTLSNCMIASLANICLECASLLVFFLSNFSMSKELDSIILFMCQYCTTAPLAEAQTLAISKLVYIAKENGDGLGQSWHPILMLFSRIASCKVSDMSLEAIDSSARQMEVQSTFVNHTQEIDSVYWNAKNLPGFAFVDFIHQLCDVSTEELCMNPPVLFTLQKIIELMRESFDRVRFIWTQSWTLVRAHFNRVACIGHSELSIYAIDGLRQLVVAGMKNQEKWQTSQTDIIIPFVTIYQNQLLIEPRKLLLSCLGIVVDNIKAAWDVVLDLCETAAFDPEKSLVTQSFGIIAPHVTDIPEHFDQKLCNVLVCYICQTNVPAVRQEAANLLASRCKLMNNVTDEILRIVAIPLENYTNKISSIVSDVYFNLVVKYTEKTETSDVIAEFVMPIFAASQIELLIHLFRSMCSIYIKSSKDQTIAQTLLPWSSRMFIEYGDFKIFTAFVEECISLACERKDLEEICSRSIISILKSDKTNNTKELVILLTSILQVSQSIPSVFACVAQRAADISCLAILTQIIPVLFNMYDEEKVSDEVMANFCLVCLSNLNKNSERQALPILKPLADLMKKRNSAFMKERRTEFQKTLFEYFTNSSSTIRELIKGLAFSSVDLFA